MSEAPTQTQPTPPAPPRRTPREWPLERWVPATGIVFVVLLVITFFLPPKSPPEAKDLQDEIAAFYSDHRTALLIALYLSGVALIIAVAAAEWRARLRPVWYTAGSLVVALVMLVAAAAWARDGFFSPTGVPNMSFIAFVLFMIWVLATSVLLLMETGALGRTRAPAAVVQA